MSIILDSSVVVRLLTGCPPAMAEIAQREVCVAMNAGETLIISDMTLAETYFALNKHYGVPKRKTLEHMLSLFGETGVETEPDSHAKDIISEMLSGSTKPGFVDRLIHSSTLKYSALLLTMDKHLAKLPQVRLLK